MRGAERLDDERLAHLENLSDARWQKEQESGDKGVTPNAGAAHPDLSDGDKKHMASSDPIRDALQELIAVQDLWRAGEARWIYLDALGISRWADTEYRALYAEHEKRHPLAWEAARKALSSPPLGVDARSASAPSHEAP